MFCHITICGFIAPNPDIAAAMLLAADEEADEVEGRDVDEEGDPAKKMNTQAQHNASNSTHSTHNRVLRRHNTKFQKIQKKRELPDDPESPIICWAAKRRSRAFWSLIG